MKKILYLIVVIGVFSSCQTSQKYDVLLLNGLILDGSGSPAYKADIGISGDSISFIGEIKRASAIQEIDLDGLAVSPGFINMLSWANESLIEDGRSMSDIKQGVTLEVFGEGWSGGPLNKEMKEALQNEQGDIKYDVTWDSFGGFLEYLQNRGVSCNIASFVGATSVRVHQVGYKNRAPDPEELQNMKELVRQAMEEGAVGLGASLIYAPAFYASTEELIELCKVVAEYDGLYISHLRSEGNALLEAFDEMIRIMKESGVRSEIYHLKAAGKENWHKMDEVIARIEAARENNMGLTADMYTYTAGATGLDAAMPPWVQEGGDKAWAKRLKDPAIRKRVLNEMVTPTTEWESLYLAAGSPDRVILVGFEQDSLKYLTGKTLAEVATLRGTSAEITAMDLVIDNNADVSCVYFLMSEENVKKQVALPWVSFCSDSESRAPEGIFLKSSTHPRAYGNFARLLAKYVRDEKVLTLEEAVRKMTSLPAENLRLEKRGALKVGYFADLAIFDPEKIQDHATFENPQQYSSGMTHVFVNGIQVLKNGEHTNEFPGRFVKPMRSK
ncbi:MAG: D-aminoacylase [Bacteroidetes bacterium]|jgi:N-acyl-D-amino-acid deacylase|nr:D-aminoacylase [Bacteroidota bacterium]MBT3748885.1 D-aminoacylase [Bacteroidota bacterium]MBT4399975.1 D-aminoacylase [Bacteroidota bacterium]MBT4409081.1 D-aminoacylase [Bacteroidota bacterium]MBT7094168.1 D-aminoacylase [Bacteroidota bacterium]